MGVETRGAALTGAAFVAVKPSCEIDGLVAFEFCDTYRIVLSISIDIFDRFDILTDCVTHSDIIFYHLQIVPSREPTYPLFKSFQRTFEDDFPFPKVGYVSSLEGSSFG